MFVRRYRHSFRKFRHQILSRVFIIQRRKHYKYFLSIRDGRNKQSRNADADVEYCKFQYKKAEI